MNKDNLRPGSKRYEAHNSTILKHSLLGHEVYDFVMLQATEGHSQDDVEEGELPAEPNVHLPVASQQNTPEEQVCTFGLQSRRA